MRFKDLIPDQEEQAFVFEYDSKDNILEVFSYSPLPMLLDDYVVLNFNNMLSDMGWTNLVPIFHDTVTFILQPEIPEWTIPYIDDVPVKGPASQYIQEDSSYEVIEENPEIR